VFLCCRLLISTHAELLVFSLPFPVVSCSSLVSAFQMEQTCCESSSLVTLLRIDQLSFLLGVLQNVFVMTGVMDEYSILLIIFRKEQCDNRETTEYGSFIKAK